MEALGVDLVFLPPSADLEYLTGFKRRVLTFGNIEYAHSWVTGCFLARGREPAFVLPRMVVAFDLPEGLSGDVTIVNELDDGEAIFERLAKSFGPVRKLAVGARAWSDTTLRLLQVFDGAGVVNADLLLNPMRRVKSKEELDVMTRACRLVDEVMGEVTPSGRERRDRARTGAGHRFRHALQRVVGAVVRHRRVGYGAGQPSVTLPFGSRGARSSAGSPFPSISARSSTATAPTSAGRCRSASRPMTSAASTTWLWRPRRPGSAPCAREYLYLRCTRRLVR